jgi:hypothetical protein
LRSLFYAFDDICEDSSAYLNSSLLCSDLIRFAKFDQSTKFGVVVIDLEIPVLELNMGVDSGDTDIVDPHVAGMSSSYLNLGLLLRIDDHNGGHDSDLFFDLLQNHIRSFGFLQLNQVVIFVFVEDSSGQFLGANLTLQSGPKVSRDAVAALGYDLVLKPSFETEKVDELKTLAWIESHVFDLVVRNVVQIAILANLLRVMTLLILEGELLGGSLELITVFDIGQNVLLFWLIILIDFQLSHSVLHSA